MEHRFSECHERVRLFRPSHMATIPLPQTLTIGPFFLKVAGAPAFELNDNGTLRTLSVMEGPEGHNLLFSLGEQGTGVR